jgi:2-alkyl-3-oxoalkanoate reductase
MKIFIAGATGVIGRRVAARLVTANQEVEGLSRFPGNDVTLRQLGAEPRTGDLFDAARLAEISADCDAILHLATAIPTKSRISAKDWSMNDRIRREGTANLIAAALQNRCGLYLQQSVTFLYGDRGGEWVDESSPIAKRQPSMLRSAVDMEKLVMDAVNRKQLPAVILRFGTFYAHDSAQTASMFDGVAKRRFPVIGNGRVYWNIVNIDDAADAVVKAVLRTNISSGNILNVCDDEPVTYRDLVDYIADTLAVPRPRSIPKIAAKVALGTELVSFLLSSARCRNSKAKNELGWQPMYPTFREGVRAEIKKWSDLSGQV